MALLCTSLVQNRFALEERLRRSLRGLLASGEAAAQGRSRRPWDARLECESSQAHGALRQLVADLLRDLGFEGPATELDCAAPPGSQQAMQSIGVLSRLQGAELAATFEQGLQAMAPGGILIAAGNDARLLTATGLLQQQGLCVVCHERGAAGSEVIAVVRPSDAPASF